MNAVWQELIDIFREGLQLFQCRQTVSILLATSTALRLRSSESKCQMRRQQPQLNNRNFRISAG